MTLLKSLLILLFALAPLGAFADQNSIGISITPLKWELSGNKGQVFHETVTAVNPNDFPLKVVPEFQDFRVLENAGIQWIPSDVENPYRMTDWITIQKDPITLKPKEQIDLPFTITVPSNASVGGHYAAIFFRAVVDSSGGSIGSIPRVGALIIFNVNGVVDKSGQVSNFSVSHFIDHGPVVFDLSLKNTGTTHYEPTAQISISNIFGSPTIITPEPGRLIYPGVSRSLKTTWNKNYPLGFYSAKLSFTDGNGTVHTTSTWFFGFPWKYVLMVLLALVVLRYLYLYLRKRFKIVRAS